jgi:hypothetical protein
MPTFPRGFVNHQTNVANAEMLERLARDTGQNVKASLARFTFSAGDEHTLRGIPAIGRGCPGRMAGTRPDAICDRLA